MKKFLFIFCLISSLSADITVETQKVNGEKQKYTFQIIDECINFSGHSYNQPEITAVTISLTGAHASSITPEQEKRICEAFCGNVQSSSQFNEVNGQRTEMKTFKGFKSFANSMESFIRTVASSRGTNPADTDEAIKAMFARFSLK